LSRMRSCRRLARSSLTPSTSMMQPAESSPVSPRRSLQPERVREGHGSLGGVLYRLKLFFSLIFSPSLACEGQCLLCSHSPILQPPSLPQSERRSDFNSGSCLMRCRIAQMDDQTTQSFNTPSHVVLCLLTPPFSLPNQRGKTVPEELVRAEDLSKYRQVASHAGLHSASVPGILCMDLCPSDTNKVLTGGADKNVVVFDKKEEQIIATLKGHTKKVTSVIYHPSQSVVFSASPDSTIRVWSVTGGNCVQVVRAHEASVTGLSLHATGDYLLSSSEDQYWAFSDIQTGRVLTKVTDEAAGVALTCAQFHPDGLIFGTGTADSQIKIWDLKERTNVANFPGHSGPVTSIAFSENGYYLATGAQDSSVKLWDLRKLKNFKTIALDNNYEVKSLVFDQSGTYLAVGGSDIRVYICKQWSEVLNFSDHSGLVTGVAFGDNAQFLSSAGMDRSLKFYSL
uniref:Pre-mRNA-processing factor 19 n=1 Tax=Oncorhynchus tshawytscha TaxID=74940 RepID=A0AAZ3NXA0_ONCTS